MAVIESTDIKVYLSGGSSNTDPDASLGDAISSTELTNNSLHNLFDKVTATEASSGDTEYRCVYIKNENGHSLTFTDPVLYIDTDSTSADTSIEVAVADEGKNATVQTIANESTAPTGESFTSATGVGNGESYTSLDDGDYIGIWIKRVVDASATALADDTAVIGTRGETTSD